MSVDDTPAGNGRSEHGDAVKRALVALRETRARLTALESARDEPIAVVGLACRLPGADDADGFWDLVENGRCAVGDVPADRWDVDAWYDPDPDAPGRMYTKRGGFVEGIDLFDADLFGINPREAAATDPQHRLLLETAWQALEDAGISPPACHGSPTGVFVGISYSDYGRRLERAGETDPYLLPGMSLNAAAGRLSYTLGLKGPSIAIDTACSSSLVAVHQAIHSLRTGECDLALAGGVNVILSPEMYVLACKARMLSPSGLCHTFDAAADGFVRGEGCGVVVLRRLSEAVARDERILALLRGSAVNQDGRTSGLTVPSSAAQEEVIRRALARARLEAADIDYIEAHGTGTMLGDPIEMTALGAVFGNRPRTAPLVVGSVKTNIGHAESAAGVAGLIKVVLSLVHGRIPAHLHLADPNPHIPWADLPMVVPTAARTWTPTAGRPRRAGISSFGFSGTNAHIVVEEAPPGRDRPVEAGRDRLFVLSARSDAALREQAGRWAVRLRAGNADAADACRVAACGRARFAERIAVNGRSAGDLAAGLQSWLTDGKAVAAGTCPDDPGGIAFLCSGQGSQHAGIGRGLYDDSAAAHAVFDQAAAVLAGTLERPLLEVMFGSDDALHETAYTQPALYTLSVALAAAWRERGIVPAAVLGHSIGEYAAAHLAGVVGFEDGLRLVAARGRLMQGLAERGAMAAVQAPADAVEEAVRRFGGDEVSLACRNGPMNQVVSGRAAAVRRVTDALAEDGRKIRPLKVSHAFHSVVMEPMIEAFAEALSDVALSPPALPMVSNVTGTVAGDEVTDPAYWIRHTREAVRFADGMATLARLGSGAYLELGPGSTLLGMAEACLADADTPVRFIPSLGRDLADDASLRTATAALFVAGHEPDWRAVNGPGQIVSLPGYAFQRKRHWLLKASDRPGGDNAAAAPDDGLLLYRVAWRATERPATPAKTSGSWIVAEAGAPGFCHAVADALARRGAEVRRMPPTAAMVAISPETTGVLFAGAAIDDPVATERALAGGLLGLAQRVAATGGARLWIVSEGAMRIGDEALGICPGASAMWGFGKAFGLEAAGSWGGLIDRDPTASAEDVVDALLAADGENQVALRGRGRFVARLERIAGMPASPYRLRGDGVYAVTGGTGALGLRVVDWLVARGAKDIVLLSRGGASPETEELARRSGERGIRIRVARCDMGNDAAVRTTFDGFGPSLRGVVHAAGIVSQVDLADETPAGVRAVLAAKVRGAWALHEATAGSDLDLFVLYSSIAALWGSKGQAAYAAANGYLDGLAAHRRGLGMPALSVNWGPWSGGGMADTAEAAWLQSSGIRLIDPDRALAALDQALAAGVPQVGVADVDWPTFAPLYAHRGGGRLFDDMAEDAEEPAADAVAAAASALVAELGKLAPRRRTARLSAFIREQAAALLGTEPSAIPAGKGFFEIGMDSFLQVELRGRLKAALGIPLPPTVALEHHTADMLARHLLADRLGLSVGGEDDQRIAGPQAAAHPAPSVSAMDDDALASLIDIALAALDRPTGNRLPCTRRQTPATP